MKAGRPYVWTAGLLAATLLPLCLIAAPNHPVKISEAQKFAILRTLVAEVGIARRPLPPDKHGIEISPAGQVLNAGQVQSALLDSGDSARVGDRVAITAITFKGDSIVFALNGGPHKQHWYSHLSVSMGSGVTPVGANSQTGPHGAIVTLKFPGAVPALTPEEVKHDLNTLIDFDPPERAEEMVKPLPASVRTAIGQHRVLVGMNEDMVVAAMGRTGNKVREDNTQGQPYEDWIYGTPPQPTVFVRFIAGRVTRVTTYRVDGTQIVDTTPDPALSVAVAQEKQQAAEQAEEASQPAPTLRRPGDPAPPTAKNNGTGPMQPPPGTMQPPDQVPIQPPAGPPGQSGPPTTPPVVCCRG